MASIYRRGNNFWVSHYVNNKQIKKYLGTSNERVARSMLKPSTVSLPLVSRKMAGRRKRPI